MGRTHRAQILMEAEEYRRLRAIARARGVSVGALVRDAVREKYLDGGPDRAAALRRLIEPVDPAVDWPDLKAELEAIHDARLP
jgi:hypothetical protein